MNNYYDILGVTKDSTTDEIKKSYRKLSKEHHPDRGGDGDKFKEISEAYGTLGEQNKRQQYDNKLNNPFSNLSGGNTNPSDLFEQFFARGGQTSRNNHPGKDLNANINVTLEEIDRGVTKNIKYKRSVFDRRQAPAVCRMCNGNGFVSVLGPFKSKCNGCNGQGRMNVYKTLEQDLSFDIPKGVKHGEKIFYPGFGNEDAGGMGNLYVIINQQQHSRFQRDGNNLITELSVTFPELILGVALEVETLTGLIKVNVLPNTKPFERLRITGKGIHSENGVGNLIVVIKVTVPQKINEREKILLEELKLSENFNNIK